MSEHKRAYVKQISLSWERDIEAVLFCDLTGYPVRPAGENLVVPQHPIFR